MWLEHPLKVREAGDHSLSDYHTKDVKIGRFVPLGLAFSTKDFIDS